MPFSNQFRIKDPDLAKVVVRTSIYFLAAALMTVVADAGPEPRAGTLGSCLKAVAAQTGPKISCDYMVLLTTDERDEMRRLTRGLLQDASCVVKVEIERALVEPALTEPDHVFKAPPQPVSCEIKTKNGGFPIKATFAPEVTFKEGRAVAGTPGLGNVEGINSYLAWPVVAFVNRSSLIGDAMLDIINTYRPRLRPSH
ncbi:MAG: hypothetical protein AB7S74_15470 [Hyphomicrobium sp.]